MFSVVTLMVLCAGPARADWPSEERWVDLTRDGLTFSDPPFDAAGPDRLDLVGDSVAAVGQWTVDADNLYLRMRASDSPLDDSGPYPIYGDAWGFFLDLEDTDDTYDFSLVLAEFGATLRLYQNTSDEGGGLADPADENLETYYAPLNEDVAIVQVNAVGVDHDGFGEDEDYFIDFSIPRDDLERLTRIHSGKAFRVGIGTAYNSGSSYDPMTLRTDQAGLFNDAPIEDPTEGLSDEIIFDEDGDGLDYPDEIILGTDPEDADTDDDSVEDGQEVEDGTDPTVPDTGGEEGGGEEGGGEEGGGEGGEEGGEEGGGEEGGEGGDDTGPPDPGQQDSGTLPDDTDGGSRLPSIDGDFTGGACSATHRGPALAPLALAMMLLAARKRR